MASVFFRSDYWGQWSRRLWAKRGLIIELDLTPISSCPSSTWDDVREENIRIHYTGRSEKDYLGPNLPAEIQQQMVKNLGEEVVNRLLNHDYLAEVPPEAIMAASQRNLKGGGISWEEVQELCGMGVFADYEGPDNPSSVV